MTPTRLALGGLLLAVVTLPAPASAQKRQRDVITRAELLASAHATRDLYQAVRSLRPHFLAPPRGVRSLNTAGRAPDPVALYVDGNPQGEIDGLKLIMTVNVEEVRYLDAAQAENQFGIGRNSGAVLVKLYKGRPTDTIPPPAPGAPPR